ncbi:hypothetical protein QQ045_032397 [Rhodiola kirilowii]
MVISIGAQLNLKKATAPRTAPPVSPPCHRPPLPSPVATRWTPHPSPHSISPVATAHLCYRPLPPLPPEFLVHLQLQLLRKRWILLLQLAECLELISVFLEDSACFVWKNERCLDL